MKKLFIAASFVLASFFLVAQPPGDSAQTFQILVTGVLDPQDYTVIVNERNLTLIPNKEGLLFDYKANTSYFGWSDGEYTLTVIKEEGGGELSKEVYSIEVRASDIKMIYVDITPKEDDRANKYLKDVLINAPDRTNLSPSSVTKRYLDANLSRLTPGTGGEILGAIKQYPGISGGHKEIIVRGSDSSDVLYMFNDVKILSPYHSFSFNSIFPLNILNNLEFYPGAFPIQYGESQGSLIEIFPKKLENATDPSLNLHINPVASDGSLYFPVNENIAVTASGRVSYYALILDVMNNLLESVENAPSSPSIELQFYDAFGAVEYSPSKEHNFYVWASTANDEFNYGLILRNPKREDIPDVVSTQYPPRDVVGTNTSETGRDIDETWSVAAMTYNFNNQRFNSKTTVSYLLRSEEGQYDVVQKTAILQDYQHLFQQLSESNQSKYSLGVSRISLKEDVYYALLPDELILGAGLDYAFVQEEIDINYLREGTPNFKTNYPSGQEVASFVNAEWLPIETLTLNTGIRVLDLAGSPAFDVRGSVFVKLIDEVNVKFGAGKYSDFQRNYYVNNTFESIFRASILPKRNATKDEDIKPYAWQYTAGIEGNALAQDYILEVYYKDLHNQRTPIPYDADFEVVEEYFAYHGEGSAYGLELLLRNKVTSFLSYSLGYSYSVSERDVFSIRESTEALDKVNKDYSKLDYANLTTYERPFIEDATHNVNFTLAWNMNKRLRWSTAYKGYSGRPYTPHVIVRPGDHVLGFLSKTHDDIEQFNQGRLPFTHNISLRFDYIAKNFIFYIDILNIDTLFFDRVLTYNPNQARNLGEFTENADLSLENGGVINAFTLVSPLMGFQFSF